MASTGLAPITQIEKQPPKTIKASLYLRQKQMILSVLSVRNHYAV